MARAEFKGSITTTGRSEALRLDKALFKAHPEFKQRAKIRAHVIGPGSLLVTLDSSEGGLSWTRSSATRWSRPICPFSNET